MFEVKNFDNWIEDKSQENLVAVQVRKYGL